MSPTHIWLSLRTKSLGINQNADKSRVTLLAKTWRCPLPFRFQKGNPFPATRVHFIFPNLKYGANTTFFSTLWQSNIAMENSQLVDDLHSADCMFSTAMLDIARLTSR